MKIYPAIDIIDGKAVRLFQGDYSQKTVYNSNPLEVAKEFERKGAKHLHIVDLDGAKNGSLCNFPIIEKIAEETDLDIEVGGGIRTYELAKEYLENGINRVILGTIAVEEPDLCRKLLNEYRDRIIIGIDQRDGFVKTRGWEKNAGVSFKSFMDNAIALGGKRFVITDISKDGAMKGINGDFYREIKEDWECILTAAGGVSSINDVLALKNAAVDGCIIGKALYNGAIDIEEALKMED